MAGSDSRGDDTHQDHLNLKLCRRGRAWHVGHFGVLRPRSGSLGTLVYATTPMHRHGYTLPAPLSKPASLSR